MPTNIDSFQRFISEKTNCKFVKPNIFQFPEKYLAFLFQEIKNTNTSNSLNLKEIQKDYLQKNIHLIVIWSDQWLAKQPIITSRINAKFGIYQQIHGRKTIVKRINKVTADTFLNINHLQGAAASKFKYGLFLKEELLAVGTFSGGRKLREKPENYRSYELIRFANKLNTRVYGGFDKLLKAFVSDQDPDDIMTYADCDWSDGTSYEKLNFKFKNEIPPTTFYINLENMDRLTEKKMDNLIQDNDNFVKIFNTGSLKFVKEI